MDPPRASTPRLEDTTHIDSTRRRPATKGTSVGRRTGGGEKPRMNDCCMRGKIAVLLDRVHPRYDTDNPRGGVYLPGRWNRKSGENSSFGDSLKSQSFGRTLSLSVLLLLLFYFHLCGSQAGLDAASSNGHRLRIRGKDQDSGGLIDGIDLGSPLSDDWLESSLLGRPLCNSSGETSRHPIGIRPQPVEQWISLFDRIR